jgi:uncharacterized protein (DUF1499 family)
MTLHERTLNRPPRLPRTAALVARVGLALTLAGALSLLLSGVGTRWDWWDYRTGFLLLRWTLYAGLVVIVVALTGLVLGLLARTGKSLLVSLVTLAVLGAVAAVPVGYLRSAGRVPPIHDGTTDPDDPPRFVAVLPLRREAPNSAEYAGPTLAAQQRAGYPDLAPVHLADPPPQAFARAVAAARSLGWQIVAAAPAEGRLEATDRTRWFGFRDDVVVRVLPEAGGSRVDVRSVSRVGRSDLGTNARRIRRFLEALQAAPATSTAR